MSRTLSSRSNKPQMPPYWQQSKQGHMTKKLFNQVIIWIAIVFLLVIEVYPLIWLLLASFKTTQEFSSGHSGRSRWAWIGRTMFRLGMRVQWGPTFASISLAVFPTLIIYLILNQQVIKGLTAGSLKG
jgi:ABC-type glycerol-3-phosphate transport system permease component